MLLSPSLGTATPSTRSLSGEQDTRQSPKVALLFLVTTHVQQAEIWGQWLSLAQGLRTPKACPLPSAVVDLVARYGPEHPPYTPPKTDSKPHATRRSRALKAQTETVLIRLPSSNVTSSASEAKSHPSWRQLSHSRKPHTVDFKRDAEELLEGQDRRTVERIYPSQSLFTVYVHSCPDHVEAAETVFLGREVPGRVATTYASHSLVKRSQWCHVPATALKGCPATVLEWTGRGRLRPRHASSGSAQHRVSAAKRRDPAALRDSRAERALFAEALKDPLNVKFMLVAHDAIPLYPPHLIWAQMMSEGDVSNLAVNGFKSGSGERWRTRWSNSMESEHLKRRHWSKSSQWVVLTRPHAMLVVRDTHVDRIFDFWHASTRISDESYIPTLLSTYDALDEIDGCGCKTSVEWPPKDSFSPTVYKAGQVDADLIASLRSGERHGEECASRDAVESSSRVFEAWGREGQTPSAASFLATSDGVARFVRFAGFRPLSSRCPLLARKFPGDAKLAVASSLLDCEGGGLSGRCDHPNNTG
ncbi:MAG: hypothetical protein WDW36_009030 [Sanguina aurantia]